MIKLEEIMLGNTLAAEDGFKGMAVPSKHFCHAVILEPKLYCALVNSVGHGEWAVDPLKSVILLADRCLRYKDGLNASDYARLYITSELYSNASVVITERCKP